MQEKRFTPSELEHLKQKAMAANVAIGAHTDFVNFLRDQHDASEAEGWQLARFGFELQTGSPQGPPPATLDQNSSAMGAEPNGRLDEELLGAIVEPA